MVQLAEKRVSDVASNTRTFHLHIRGRVQGVGFRPFVYKFARSINLKGSVRNDTDGVHIYFNCSNRDTAEEIANDLVRSSPTLAIIKGFSLTEEKTQRFIDFEISESRVSTKKRLMITPDLAMCPECRSELSDPRDRRYRYPFITCTNCGPRYSIMTGLPYDRPMTTMEAFLMCPTCTAEYHNILDRRHFSQTNSCKHCQVTMSCFDNTGRTLVSADNTSSLNLAVKSIERGEIIALKGIGGYLLLTDARNADSITRLRERKRRPRKPFAVMYPDIESLAGDADIPPGASDLLSSPESPIVLLPLKSITRSGIATEVICPGLDQIGAMLPYTGVFDLLLQRLGFPVIATSGNLSDSPIIYTNEGAVGELNQLVDFIITNDRDICAPQDDSVVRPVATKQKSIILRRSRGLAPGIHNNPIEDWSVPALAFGADLKGAFGISANGEIYISQFLGNLEHIGSQESFRNTLEHLDHLVGVQPELIVRDMHPGYFSSGIAGDIARKHSITELTVQHHVAHFCAVLGENDLLNCSEPVLGVIWDGTGYGADGQIWGGEFFGYNGDRIERIAHIEYFPHLYGDKMSREPRLSAYSVFRDVPGAIEIIHDKFSAQELDIYEKMGPGALRSSSMGRVFDAVASILGLCDRMDYEGEAAILLEQAARKFDRGLHGTSHPYPFELTANGTVDLSSMLTAIIRDFTSGTPREQIAMNFHTTLASVIISVARKHGIRSVAFSGGVFQNALLCELCERHASEGIHVYYHNELSPNDENIAYGQLVCAYLQREKGLKIK